MLKGNAFRSKPASSNWKSMRAFQSWEHTQCFVRPTKRVRKVHDADICLSGCCKSPGHSKKRSSTLRLRLREQRRQWACVRNRRAELARDGVAFLLPRGHAVGCTLHPRLVPLKDWSTRVGSVDVLRADEDTTPVRGRPRVCPHS